MRARRKSASVMNHRCGERVAPSRAATRMIRADHVIDRMRPAHAHFDAWSSRHLGHVRAATQAHQMIARHARCHAAVVVRSVAHRRPPNRQDRPLPSRTVTRPREFTVTRPARADSDTPDFDMFSQLVRLVRTRLRKIKPITFSSTSCYGPSAVIRLVAAAMYLSPATRSVPVVA